MIAKPSKQQVPPFDFAQGRLSTPLRSGRDDGLSEELGLRTPEETHIGVRIAVFERSGHVSCVYEWKDLLYRDARG
jgi:hypothetical protein